jgi:hypothetical protein
MIYGFDTSGLNSLLDDPECDAIAKTLVGVASVRVSALNVIEAIKTPDVSRRVQLLQLMSKLAAGKRPLDRPNSILLSYADAHAAGESRAPLNSDPQLEGVWIALNQPELLDENALDEATAWAAEQERDFAAVVAADRSAIQAKLALDRPGKARTAAGTLRAFFGATNECHSLVADIYSRQTGRTLDNHSFQGLLKESAWPLYLLSHAYGMHTRSVRVDRHSASKNAGAIDLSQSVYLTLCDRFVTNDGPQYRALRHLNVLNRKRRTQVLRYTTFRRRLLGLP